MEKYRGDSNRNGSWAKVRLGEGRQKGRFPYSNLWMVTQSRTQNGQVSWIEIMTCKVAQRQVKNLKM